jgi:hypothetical protein
LSVCGKLSGQLWHYAANNPLQVMDETYDVGNPTHAACMEWHGGSHPTIRDAASDQQALVAAFVYFRGQGVVQVLS